MARICVFCSSSTRIDPAHPALARELGLGLAARGHDLVSGGGRASMMGAVADAVREGGGHTLGVIPEAMIPWEVADTAAHELVVTADMRERKGRMDAAADAFVALPGGLGTLEELLEVWTSHSLGMHARPVVVLDPTGLYAPLRTFVEGLAARGFVKEHALRSVHWTTDVPGTLDLLDRALAPVA